MKSSFLFCRNLLSNIVRTFMASSEIRGSLVLSSSGKAVIANHTPLYLPMLHRCMESIVPKVCPAENSEVASCVHTSKVRFEDLYRDRDWGVSDASSSYPDISPNFFVPGVVPPITEFGPEQMYLTINSAELCSALLFDDRR